MSAPTEAVPASVVNVTWIEDTGIADIPSVGGKNASLGELSRSLQSSGVRVPEAFATTAAAYRSFVAANDLEPRIRKHMDDHRAGRATLRQAGAAIRELFLQASFPDAIAADIQEHYRDLCRRTGQAPPTPMGVVLALLAAPAVLAADWIHKAVRNRRRPAQGPSVA